MTTGERIKSTLQVAGLTPRHLGGATKIHFVTIYRSINGANELYAVHEDVLTKALTKIEALVAKGDLPMRGKLSRKEKTDRLTHMLAND